MPQLPTETFAEQVISLASSFLSELSERSGDNTMGIQQVQLLLNLYLRGEVNQEKLMVYTGVERSATSRNVAKLGAGERPALKPGPGYVESFEDPRDRRTKLVRLTPLGRDLLLKAASGVK